MWERKCPDYAPGSSPCQRAAETGDMSGLRARPHERFAAILTPGVPHHGKYSIWRRVLLLCAVIAIVPSRYLYVSTYIYPS